MMGFASIVHMVMVVTVGGGVVGGVNGGGATFVLGWCQYAAPTAGDGGGVALPQLPVCDGSSAGGGVRVGFFLLGGAVFFDSGSPY